MVNRSVTKSSDLSTRENDELPSDDQLARLLRNIAMRLTRRLRYERRSDSIGPTHSAVLVSLNAQGPMTPTALSELERIAPPWVTRVVAQLEERNLVERFQHPDDGRQRLIKITEAGKRRIEKHRASDSAWLAKPFVTISDDDRKVLNEAFELIQRLYNI